MCFLASCNITLVFVCERLDQFISLEILTMKQLACSYLRDTSFRSLEERTTRLFSTKGMVWEARIVFNFDTQNYNIQLDMLDYM